MRISARNVFAGNVRDVTKGAVNAEVTIILPGGEHIVSIITNPSVDSLELAEGKPAFAIIKASDVIVGKNLGVAKLSARNVLPGEVTNVVDGAVSSEVVIRLTGRELEHHEHDPPVPRCTRSCRRFGELPAPAHRVLPARKLLGEPVPRRELRHQSLLQLHRASNGCSL